MKKIVVDKTSIIFFMSPKNLRTWVVISKSSLKNNYHIFRKLIDEKCLLMAVTKSNAYGHELVDYVKTMSEFGVDWLGVDSITEALTLRKKGIKKPILVLGYTLPINFKAAINNDISLTISGWENLDNLQKLSASAKKLNIHLKIDTGMHRQGFQLDEVPRVAQALKRLTSIINIEGVYTHFASAKDPESPQDTKAQIKKFNQAIKILEKAGLKPLRHAAASGGTILYPQAHYDLVRVGAGLYGFWPSKEAKKKYSKLLHLEPGLSWKTIVCEIKTIPKGERVGYDFTQTLARKTVIGVCPVGYWHGLPRSLSSSGSVLVNGKRAKILGRVSMDMITIDLTDIINVAVGAEVTIIGKDKNEEITAEEIADLCGTTNYEILTRINPLIKRIYV